mmetsp:Transcript_6000/g.10087  ORF Transcript_6000/g.10087 Transcript_6000/m.10087 type:complete len:232 (+) Transcript_6000:3126-3821(+)
MSQPRMTFPLPTRKMNFFELSIKIPLPLFSLYMTVNRELFSTICPLPITTSLHFTPISSVRTPSSSSSPVPLKTLSKTAISFPKNFDSSNASFCSFFRFFLFFLSSKRLAAKTGSSPPPTACNSLALRFFCLSFFSLRNSFSRSFNCCFLRSFFRRYFSSLLSCFDGIFVSFVGDAAAAAADFLAAFFSARNSFLLFGRVDASAVVVRTYVATAAFSLSATSLMFRKIIPI